MSLPNPSPSKHTPTGRMQAYTAEVKALLTLSWPIMIAQLAQMGTGVVDTIMAGRYSAIDLAAVAIGYNIWLAVILGLIAGPLCYFANPLLALLELDVQTQEKSLAYLQATSFGMPAAALRAFKDTRFPFLVMAIAYWLIALPLGYWLGFINAEDATGGTVGFWKAMIVGIGVATLLVLWRQGQLLRRPLPVPEH